MKIKNILPILLLSIIVSSCSLIDSAEVGIKFKKFSLTEQGTIKAEPASGFVLYNPFTTSIFKYPVFVQRVNFDSFNVWTKDGAQFQMDPLLAYKVNKDRAIDIFSKHRKRLDYIQDGYMRTVIYDAYRVSANNYTSEELVSSRAKFEGEVRAMLEKSLIDEGFIVEEFTSQIIPPNSLIQSIDAKNTAVQNALQAENRVLQAEAEAKINVATAKGKAEAIKIEADGEAYYNRTVAASITSLLVQQQSIEKWDGKLPQVQGSNTPIINLGAK